jgi:hypothetical protein
MSVRADNAINVNEIDTNEGIHLGAMAGTIDIVQRVLRSGNPGDVLR